MEIDVVRYNSKEDFTDGLLLINGIFACHTLEDEFRSKKVFGKTRIPQGRYEIEFRDEGGFHNKYLKMFGDDWHAGMLHIVNIPNFKNVLIHIGNKHTDTAGCLLVAMDNSADDAGYIGKSKVAYKKIYPIIRDALLKGEKVYINYYDSAYAA